MAAAVIILLLFSQHSDSPFYFHMSHQSTPLTIGGIRCPLPPSPRAQSSLISFSFQAIYILAKSFLKFHFAHITFLLKHLPSFLDSQTLKIQSSYFGIQDSPWSVLNSLLGAPLPSDSPWSLCSHSASPHCSQGEPGPISLPHPYPGLSTLKLFFAPTQVLSVIQDPCHSLKPGVSKLFMQKARH